MKKWPWKKDAWKKRARLIERLILPADSVLDLGGGMGGLRRLIPENEYVSMDKEKWTPETTMADFNKGEYPRLREFDVIVCQGIIEYMENPIAFLSTISMYGKKMIATYYAGENNRPERKNHFTFRLIEDTFRNAGWDILQEEEVSASEKLYICTRV